VRKCSDHKRFALRNLWRLLVAMDFDAKIERTGTGSLKWNKYRGRDILPLWVADMDFRSPEPVIHAMRRRLEHGVFGYTLAEQGCTEAVVEYLEREHGWRIQPEWLVWTPGLVPAINLTCRAFAEPGDAILTMTPVYYPFLSAPEYAGLELQAVPLVLDSSRECWDIDFERLEATVSKRTKVLILSNPHNPVGRVFTRDEMLKLADFVVKHDLILCSDEIHCDLILNASAHICAGTLGAELQQRLVAMFSPSKTYNLAGLACAFLVVPDGRVRSRLQRCIRGIITEVNCMGYAACEAAYREGEPWRLALIDYLEGNRALIYQAVAERLGGVKVYPMDATYLAWLDVRGLGLEQPAAFFEQWGVGLSEGATFQGKGFVRLNFGCSRAVLGEGLSRMERAVRSLG
jgi:cysteine-S-conjugate beta-lyase